MGSEVGGPITNLFKMQDSETNIFLFLFDFALHPRGAESQTMKYIASVTLLRLEKIKSKHDFAQGCRSVLTESSGDALLTL